MDKTRCIIVIPVYKEFTQMNANEQAAIKNTLQVLKNYAIAFIGPGRIKDSYKNLGVFIPLKLERMTYKDYSKLCKDSQFYEMFMTLGYRYMLLVQQDVWILNDKLEYFLDIFDKEGLDFIGAPWYKVPFAKDGTVGNGGFCIRRLEKFRDVCKKYTGGGNEDVFFLMKHKKEFKIAPEKLALEFSWEEKPAFAYYLSKGKLPMGSHAYASTPDRIGFWKNFIPGIQEIKCKSGNPFIYFSPDHTV